MGLEPLEVYLGELEEGRRTYDGTIELYHFGRFAIEFNLYAYVTVHVLEATFNYPAERTEGEPYIDITDLKILDENGAEVDGPVQELRTILTNKIIIL